MPSPDTPAWTGAVSAKVSEYGRRLDGHDSDIRDMRAAQQNTAMEVVRLASDVRELQTTIKQAVTDISQARQEELTDLKEALAGKSLTTREKVLYIAVPLLVAVVGVIAVVVTATHGGA